MAYQTDECCFSLSTTKTDSPEKCGARARTGRSTRVIKRPDGTLAMTTAERACRECE